MKLLMTTDTVGGVWTYALDLARALRPHGVEIALATMGAPLSPDQRRDASMLDNVRVHESSFKLEWMQDPWDDVRMSGEWLLDLEQRFDPDVVHLNGYAHGQLPFGAPIVIVAHSCVMSWWRAVKGEAAPAEWNRYRDEVSRGLHDADIVVAPTRAMLDALEENYGPLHTKRVIHNGRDPHLYRPARKEQFILTAGRLWDEAKNVAALQAVAPRVAWPICVAGEEKSPDGAGAQAVKDRGVLALGRLDAPSLAHWFARADIYALPARYEPFGLSALEAAMCGCALVLGDIPSLREVWGDAATFVPPDDHDALRAALQSLIEHPPRRREMAGRAMERAQSYAPQRMADAYAGVYRESIRRRRMVDVDVQIADAFSAVHPFQPM
ncbi:MAG TPA: glycosyltransferase family 4 protein [Tepidisphaeraceae bacterium]|nr:glycosyltransferase family 4 protein [Tepidisphaeraceae bacterium]